MSLLLTVPAPGLGHIYSGEARRGGYLVVGVLLVGFGLLLASMHLQYAPLRVGLLLLLPACWLFAYLDAWRVAGRACSDFVPRFYNRWYVYVAWVLIFQAIQPALRTLVHQTVAEAFHIPGDSMNPTVLQGDYLLAAPRRDRPVQRGSVVVVRREGGMRLLQRLIAMPGDTVEMRAKVLILNGEPQSEGYVRHIDATGEPSASEMLWQRDYLAVGDEKAGQYSPSRDNWGPLVIPQGHYFLMGDNRDNSYDSRYVGLTAEADIIGRAGWVYFSRNPDGGGGVRWDRIGLGIR